MREIQLVHLNFSSRRFPNAFIKNRKYSDGIGYQDNITKIFIINQIIRYLRILVITI